MKGSNPSKSEKAHWARMCALVGCIACRIDGRFNSYCLPHHIDGRTKPGSHMKVLPLCAEHHMQDDTDPLGRIAVHPNKGRFEARYGPQNILLENVLDHLQLDENFQRKG